MRFYDQSPQFPGFSLESEGNVAASYHNIYLDDINIDWKVIIETHHMDEMSRLERLGISYCSDGTVKELELKIIAEEKDGFNHYWIQLLTSKDIYLIASCNDKQCFYYGDLIKLKDFYSLWSRLNLSEMKPKGNFEWYEFDFYGTKECYACEDTKKYFIKDHEFIQFGNDKLPLTGYFISSYGMAKAPGNQFTGQCYQDYFFEVCES